jgi:putative ABC transport system permease protein
MFTLENLRQFGALKAMGARNGQLIRMILLQAFVVGAIGYGLGIGSTAVIFGQYLMKMTDKLAFYMPWEILAGSGVAIFLMVAFSSIFSIWKVVWLEPAVVFKG